MEKLLKLSAVLRYVGLNLNPQVLELIITLNEKLGDGELSLGEIDNIVNAIDVKNAAPEQAQAPSPVAKAPVAKKAKKAKLEKA